MIEKLPEASLYQKFAYHIALLKQFARDTGGAEDQGNATTRRMRRGSTNDADDSGRKVSSVHGSNVYRDLKKQRKTQSVANLGRSSSKDKLNNSWHSGQPSGGMKRANSGI